MGSDGGINEGDSRNYSESFRDYELAVIDTSDPKFDDVVAIPDTHLARRDSVQNPRMPFRVVTKAYYPNSTLARRHANTTLSAESAAVPVATQGVGPNVVVTPLPLTYKMNEVNVPSAVIELIGAEGSLGTWLFSPHLGAPQTLAHAGRTWNISLRIARDYKPVALQLL